MSNAEVYDFELDNGDMAEIDGLDQGKAGAISWNPVDAYWFTLRGGGRFLFTLGYEEHIVSS